MGTSLGDSIKEYGFVLAGGLAGIIFARTVIIGEATTSVDYLVMPLAIAVGYAAGRKIRRSMGKTTSDERDIQNYEGGMSWGFITFAGLTAVEAGTNLSLATTDILMWSVSVALSATLYVEIRQSGLRGLIR